MIAGAVVAYFFTRVSFRLREPLGVPPPEMGTFDHVPRNVPTGYWWSWVIPLAGITAVGLVFLISKRTRKAAIIYLVLALLLTIVQVVVVFDYEWHRWDTQFRAG